MKLSSSWWPPARRRAEMAAEFDRELDLQRRLQTYIAAVITRDDEIRKLRAALDLANRDRDSQRAARLRTLGELQELQQRVGTEER